MSPRSFVMLLATALLVVGLGVLMWGSTASDGTSCSGNAAEMADAGTRIGAAINGEEATADTRVAECASAVSTRMWIGWPMAIVGAVALLGGLVVRTTPTVSKPKDLAAD